MELQAAFFDFGGVVTTPILDSFSRLDRALGLDDGTVLQALRAARDEPEPDFHKLEKGTLSEADYYRGLHRRLEKAAGRTLDFPEDPKAVRRSLLGGLERNEEMLDAIGRIGKHYAVGMITNNVREWGAWRDHYPMELFQIVIDSSEVGLRKPDPEIYRLACDKLEVEPERSAFVDDLPQNVAGANAVGMHGILFTTTEAVLTELRTLFPAAF